MIDSKNFSNKPKNNHNHTYDNTKALLNNPVSEETEKILTDIFIYFFLKNHLTLLVINMAKMERWWNKNEANLNIKKIPKGRIQISVQEFKESSKYITKNGIIELNRVRVIKFWNELMCVGDSNTYTNNIILYDSLNKKML